MKSLKREVHFIYRGFAWCSVFFSVLNIRLKAHKNKWKLQCGCQYETAKYSMEEKLKQNIKIQINLVKMNRKTID